MHIFALDSRWSFDFNQQKYALLESGGPNWDYPHLSGTYLNECTHVKYSVVT